MVFSLQCYLYRKGKDNVTDGEISPTQRISHLGYATPTLNRCSPCSDLSSGHHFPHTVSFRLLSAYDYPEKESDR